MKFIEDMNKYWSSKADSFSEYNDKEHNSELGKLWESFLKKGLGDRKNLNVLEVGCGPGFFAILLAKMGHNVTAVDYSEQMLEKAKENAKKYGVEDKIKFMRMDAQNLKFEDEIFDAVTSRMITWILDDTKKAYEEWVRVVKPDGIVINIDANWYLHLHDKEAEDAFEKGMEEYKNSPYYKGETDETYSQIEEIQFQLPMSKVRRPQWDADILTRMDVNSFKIIPRLRGDIYIPEYNIIYKYIPTFMIIIEK